MPELTAAAQKWLDAGNTEGPGTPTCIACKQPKEPTRLNSSRCRACGAKPSPNTEPGLKALTIYLPPDVIDRLVAEAGEAGVGYFLRELIVRRDTRKTTPKEK